MSRLSGEKITSASDVHWRKAESSILSTDEGILSRRSEVQKLNPQSIVRRLFDLKRSSVSAMQFKKLSGNSVSADEGISIRRSEVQYGNPPSTFR
jgi:hypothetical protein